MVVTPAPKALVPATFVPVTLASWFTVRLGIHKTAEAYIAELEAKRMKVGTYARQNLAKIPITSEESDIELFLGSARNFGFMRNTPRQIIFNRAAESGYYPCPAEVGPAARIQYANQPKGEYRTVAMEPIAVSDGNLKLFNLERGDVDVWLNTDRGHSDYGWNPVRVWVWCRRKP